jgi:hypothetical protein
MRRSGAQPCWARGVKSTVGETQAVFGQGPHRHVPVVRRRGPAQFKHLAQVQASHCIRAQKDAGFAPGGQYKNNFNGYTSSSGYNVSLNNPRYVLFANGW